MKAVLILLLLAVGANAAIKGMQRQAKRATCYMQPTAAAKTNGLNIYGHFTFAHRAADDTLDVQYSLYGLPSGLHSYHVHQWGDIFTDNGNAVGGHFIGTTGNLRPGTLKEVGALNNGVPIDAVAGNPSIGSFNDPLAKLNGPNSILGRGMIIHGLNGNSGTRIAQCVIGKNDTANTEKMQPWVADVPMITRAICNLKATKNSANAVHGYIDLELMPGSSAISVKAFISGLPAGPHPWHIHQIGDVSDPAGLAVTGHFIGNITGTGRAEVGQIGYSNDLMSNLNAADVANNVARSQLMDPVLAFNGENSIIGRSFIIHKSLTDATRLAQCVIGITRETPAQITPDTPGSVAKVIRAGAILKATSANADPDLYGTVDFTIAPDNSKMTVRWFVFGLSPNMNHTWHVHEKGNIGAINDGSGPGPHFLGTGAVRPTGQPQEVGLLDNGLPMWADATGYSSGEIVDLYPRLNGINNIVGRAVIIHGKAGNSGARVARGVIGRVAEMYNTQGAENTYVSEAMCYIEKTRVLSATPGPAGWFKFVANDNAGNFPATIKVTYSLTGLPPGNHGYHVHTWGEIIGFDDAMSVGGHFIGTNPMRPVGKLQEVGLLNGGAPMQVAGDGTAAGEFDDDQIRLYGVNSIIGRAVVIHGNGTASAVGTSIRIAQCVIGMSVETSVPVPPGPEMSSSTGLSAASVRYSVAPAFFVATFAAVAAVVAFARKTNA